MEKNIVNTYLKYLKLKLKSALYERKVTDVSWIY